MFNNRLESLTKAVAKLEKTDAICISIKPVTLINYISVNGELRDLAIKVIDTLNLQLEDLTKNIDTNNRDAFIGVMAFYINGLKKAVTEKSIIGDEYEKCCNDISTVFAGSEGNALTTICKFMDTSYDLTYRCTERVFSQTSMAFIKLFVSEDFNPNNNCYFNAAERYLFRILSYFNHQFLNTNVKSFRDSVLAII